MNIYYVATFGKTRRNSTVFRAELFTEIPKTLVLDSESGQTLIDHVYSEYWLFKEI